MKNELNIGVVGWNGRGGTVARDAYDATGGLMTPVACVEPHEEAYTVGCETYGLKPRRYVSVEDMLAKEALDGAIIASPNAFHLENLRQFKGSGVPLMLEKPLDSTFEKICDVVRFCRDYEAPVAVGHCMRYAPILQEACKMLRRGDVGDISSVRFVQHCHYGNAGYHNWRRKKETSGTWLIEKATHDFDIMLWFLQTQPRSVAAFSRLHAFGGDKPADLRCRDCGERLTCPESIQNIHYRTGSQQAWELQNAHDLCCFSSEVDTPDNDHCLLAFDNGVVGSYVQWYFSPRSYHHRTYEVFGTEGALEVDLGAECGGKITFCPRYGASEDRMERTFDYLGRNHYNGDGYMGLHLVDVFRGAAEPETTVEQAFLAEMTGYAAVLSSEEGRFVDIKSLLPDDLKDISDGQIY